MTEQKNHPLRSLRKPLWCVLALLLGVFICVQTILLLPQQYDLSYLGELTVKYERLRLMEGKKLVVVGGSSVAFGLDSAEMERLSGLRTVNFGLYATLGTHYMMDLTRGNLGEGDIVILSPETDENGLTMAFNGLATWEASEGNWPLLLKVRGDDRGEMLGSFYAYAQQKLSFFRSTKPDPEGVYRKDSFNELGDIVYARPENIMEGGVDLDTPISLDESVVDEEFIDYVNAYVRYAERQGAQVYFAYPPMNRDAVVQDEDGRAAFDSYLRSQLDCEIITDIESCLYDSSLFYDTNFHLNDEGVPLRTRDLAAALYAALTA